MAPLKLEEVIWEITDLCNRNCEYCGSNGYMRKYPSECRETDFSGIVETAREIASYPPKEITISGGEPGLVPAPILQEVYDILHKVGCVVKVITNGMLFATETEIWRTFDWIGYSVNTQDDVALLRLRRTKLPSNITIVTNFGKHNIWDFDMIADAVGDFTWQVQLTMGTHRLTSDGIKYLRDKLQKVRANVILADNLQDTHDCGAGIRSCGILFDGSVVACLSERASYQTKPHIYGCLKTRTLKTIWENEFKDIRFDGISHSCRNCMSYPCEEDSLEEVSIIPERPCIVPAFPERPTVTLYGVSGGNVIAYGVQYYWSSTNDAK